jgi:hypothetical protein
MEQGQRDKGPEQVGDAASALRKEGPPHLVIPIGTIIPRIIPILLISEWAVVGYPAVGEGDVHSVVAEAEGGAGSKVILKQNQRGGKLHETMCYIIGTKSGRHC